MYCMKFYFLFLLSLICIQASRACRWQNKTFTSCFLGKSCLPKTFLFKDSYRDMTWGIFWQLREFLAQTVSSKLFNKISRREKIYSRKQNLSGKVKATNETYLLRDRHAYLWGLKKFRAWNRIFTPSNRREGTFDLSRKPFSSLLLAIFF